MGEEVKSSDIALKAQKKFLSSMASTALTKMVIDDRTACILDEFYNLQKLYSGSKKDAEKLLKNIVKVMVKVAVLDKNGKFTNDEQKQAVKLQQTTKIAAMTIISFCDVDFTFEKFVLSKQINQGRTHLQQLVSAHLQEKSKQRINSVFDALGNPDFLEAIFEQNSKFRPSLQNIAAKLKDLLNDGVL